VSEPGQSREAVVEKLRADLERASESGATRQLSERPQALREYVAAPGREPVESYAAIRELLQAHWKIPVIETEDRVAELEQLGGARGSIGRCGVRLLDLVGSTDIHIVVRGDPRGEERQMLWTLLHELGHLAWHLELLESVGAVYQRVCLNPGLETELARFSLDRGPSLQRMTELEADLFALDWLIPRWWFGEATPPGLPEALTADGHRCLSLRRAFGSQPLPLSEAAVAGLNRAGEEERRRSEEALRPGSTRWARAAWLLWNRERLECPLSAELVAEYDLIVGGGGRYVPELRQPAIGPGGLEPDPPWLPRVAPDAAAAAVDEPGWVPRLVASEGPRYPEYNIPIRPLPSPEPRDSRLRWSHMFKPATQKALSLESWIGRAREQGVGLLLFPRTPAERALDSRGVPRA